MVVSSDIVTVEVGRMVSIDCTVTSVNGGDQVNWFKLDDNGIPIPS